MDLNKILAEYRKGERGLPDYRECVQLAAQMARLADLCDLMCIALENRENFEVQT